MGSLWNVGLREIKNVGILKMWGFYENVGILKMWEFYENVGILKMWGA